MGFLCNDKGILFELKWVKFQATDALHINLYFSFSDSEDSRHLCECYCPSFIFGVKHLLLVVFA